MQHFLFRDGAMRFGFGIPGIDPNVRGLGDVVAAVAERTGVAAVARSVERITGKPCGCADRRRRLNEAVPFGRGPAAGPDSDLIRSAAKVDEGDEPI
jgi:hypothetical protein